MSTLNYPYTITAGTEENINQVMSNFRAIETWANNDIDDTNMASGYDISPTLATEELLLCAGYNSSTTTGVCLLTRRASGTVCASGAAGTGASVFYFDNSRYQVAGRTLTLRLQITACTNGAPGCNFTFGLYPMTATSPGSGVAIKATAGTVVSGSTVTFTTPGANTVNTTSVTFSAPTTGYYAIGVLPSGAHANVITGTARLGAYWT